VGANHNGFGKSSGRFNTASYSNGFGVNTNYYNSGSYNLVLGDNSNASFKTNSGGAKTFDYTDITTATDNIHIAAHGFGTPGTWVNLLYTQGTSAITGLTSGTIYQFYIVDADNISATLGARQTVDITAAGTGTGHSLAPQYVYSGCTVVGCSLEPTGSNQILLGYGNGNLAAWFDATDWNLIGGLKFQIGKSVGLKSGTDAKIGTVDLVAGSATVSTTAVGDVGSSQIMLTSQVDSGTPGFLRVSSRVVGTSFTIDSSSVTDTSAVGWMIIDIL